MTNLVTLLVLAAYGITALGTTLVLLYRDRLDALLRDPHAHWDEDDVSGAIVYGVAWPFVLAFYAGAWIAHRIADAIDAAARTSPRMGEEDRK